MTNLTPASDDGQTNTEQETAHPLAHAPQDVKLAVDLIYLLETNEIPKDVALSALEMVKNDLLKK